MPKTKKHTLPPEEQQTGTYVRKDHSFLDEKITFDRFVRGLLLVMGVVGLYYLLDALSGVLLPFFVAWLLAYMMYPLIIFLEQKCRIRYRLLSIMVAIVVVFGVLAALIVFTVPPAVQQMVRLSDDLLHYASTYLSGTDIPEQIEFFLRQNFDRNTIVQFFRQDEVVDAIHAAATQAWEFLSGTMSIVWFFVDVMMVLLYLLFFLLDYEKVNKNWLMVVPKAHRAVANHIASDIKREMNAYFRGQALVAFLVGVLFSIGFLITDFPMAIGLGLFIGLLNMVPYAQTLGFIPAIILALLKSNDTGQSFWLILLMAIVVFCVVQAIQDLFLVPKIMGKAMGLKPAIILLALSVWGSLLGIIGFIIALPMTTLGWAYYQRFVLKEPVEETK
ncbi:MAG: AI-2E family transporter [Bacteroidaceae bacterium]|nr:AI-2E family transporter [Bacteroidaceae bacterium]